MAKSKKKVSKKKSVPKRAPKRSGAQALTDGERARLLKPRASYDDAIDSLLEAWQRYRSDIRVPGLTPAKLRSLARRAQRAWLAEDRYRQKVEQKLRQLSDARLLAEDGVWRAALDVYDLAKSVGRRRPEIGKAVEFMSQYVGGRARAGGGEKPPPSS